jgi:hypothetical protein
LLITPSRLMNVDSTSFRIVTPSFS